MSNRDKFRQWISGHYNVRHPFNDIIDWLAFSDETGTDLSALEARVTADEIKMQAFYDEIHEQTGGEHTNAHDWCAHLHDLLDGKADINHTHSYNDLSDKPTIPAAQVKADWNALSGMAEILNKPTLFNGTWGALTGKPSTFPATTHTHPISDVTNPQTELDGKIPKNPKAAARTNVTTGTSGLAVTVLGLSVISAAALTRLDEYGAAINDILARLRSREIIAT